MSQQQHGTRFIKDGAVTLAKINAAAKASAATASVLIERDANGRAQVADPAVAADIATKNYVDAVASGLDVKASCRVATATFLPAFTGTGTGTLTGTTNAVLVVDGVTVALGDRILVKDEIAPNGRDPIDNGIYEVTQEGDGSTQPYILTRAADADTDAEVTSGMFTFVTEGSTVPDTGWVLTTNDPITLGTTELFFSKFSSIAASVWGKYSGTAAGGETVLATTTNVLNKATQVNIDGIMLSEQHGDYSVNLATGDVTLTTALVAGEKWDVQVVS